MGGKLPELVGGDDGDWDLWTDELKSAPNRFAGGHGYGVMQVGRTGLGGVNLGPYSGLSPDVATDRVAFRRQMPDIPRRTLGRMTLDSKYDPDQAA